MVSKEKISITLNPTQVREVSDRVENKYDNRSEAIRALIDKGAEYERIKAENEDFKEQLESATARLQEYDELRSEYDTLQDEYEALEARHDDLQRQLAAVNSRQEDVGELVEYVEEERSWRSAGLGTRMKWWLFGKSEE